MTDLDLRFVADALLALCEPEPSAPFYTEPRFELRLKTDQRRAPDLAARIPPGPDLALDRECRAVIRHAKLTRRQWEVVHMRLAGITFEQIGQLGGHSKQGAQNIFVAALKKIRHAFAVYPYTGLSDVYRSETRRGCRAGGFGTMHRG
jgi:hypothetical protein